MAINQADSEALSSRVVGRPEGMWIFGGFLHHLSTRNVDNFARLIPKRHLDMD